MDDGAYIRRSHCAVCGIRLSVKNLFGDIVWQPSHVAEQGLFCSACYRIVTRKGGRKGAAQPGANGSARS